MQAKMRDGGEEAELAVMKVVCEFRQSDLQKQAKWVETPSEQAMKQRMCHEKSAAGMAQNGGGIARGSRRVGKGRELANRATTQQQHNNNNTATTRQIGRAHV